MATLADMSALGRTLSFVREQAGITQVKLSKAMGSNTTRVCRIEKGDAGPSEEEIDAYLTAVGSELARDYRAFLQVTWANSIQRPPFPHPNWRTLQVIDAQLARIAALKEDKETKAVFVRALDLYAADLHRCAAFLERLEHHLVFVGIISVGKTTTICTSVNLVLGNDALGFARRMVLEAGGGRITLCEVQVKAGPEFGLVIEPCTDEEIRQIVLDYADQLLAMARQPKVKAEAKGKGAGRATHADRSTPGAPDETPWVPEEMARAIRGLASVSELEAEALADAFRSREELAIQILSRMDLLRRRDTVIWRPDDDKGIGDLEWLQKVFKDINNGRRPGFSLPKRVTVVVPHKPFDSGELNIAIIDTKGIDQTSAREDIDAHFDDPHAIVLLCTKFGEAPDLASINLLRRAKALHARAGLDGRLVLLVLARNAEALDMKDEARNDFVDSASAGYAAKMAHVRRALQPLNADDLPIHVLNASIHEDIQGFRTFVVDRFNALREQYVDRVSELVQELDQLVQNRTAEEHALMLAEVMEHLRTWTDNHRCVEHLAKPYLALSQGIANAHPRTLWASVRRAGDWGNFNYYYQLGYATRQLVAATAGEQVKNLKAVIDNLAARPDYSDAKDFLRQVSDFVDAGVEKLARQAQVTGQTLFRERLHADSTYWKESEQVYGTGSPFRIVVADKTRKWFDDASVAELHARLEAEIIRGWNDVIDQLAGILDSGTVP